MKKYKISCIEPILITKKICRRFILILLGMILRFIPINSRKIVFSNYYGKGYGDNGKYIVEKLLEYKENVSIIWLSNDIDKTTIDSSKSVKFVLYGSLRSRYELASAKIWVDNCRKTYYPKKKKKQFYIQTWHSPLRLKHVEMDAESKLSSEYINIAKNDSKMIDIITSGCDYSTSIFKKSFWYEGRIVNTGTPRCDIFFRNNSLIDKKVRVFFQINDNMKICIFAPTFRNTPNFDYKLNYELLLQELEEKFHNTYILLVRLHPNIAENPSNTIFSSKIINASHYDDMQELLFASDILITDYSSSMFDMLIARKKCFLYSWDLESYLKNERGMYFKISELPFSFSGSNEELLHNVRTFHESSYERNINQFLDRINSFEDGYASKRVSDLIISLIKKSNRID